MEGQRGTNRSQRGLFFKFMFISVLKRVESLFKNSSAAPIHDKKDRSRHGAAVCGAGSGPGALLPGGTGTAGGAAAARDGGERLGNRLGRREGLCPGHAARRAQGGAAPQTPPVPPPASPEGQPCTFRPLATAPVLPAVLKTSCLCAGMQH